MVVYADQALPEHMTMENQETYLPKYKLLIADDHAVLRKTLALWVSNLYPEMQILEAENGLETLHKCNHQAIDLILLDLKLPDMNGYQVVRRIKETFPQIHVYIMSMYEGESYLREALLAGANGFFSKNTMDEELPLILGRFLESMES